MATTVDTILRIRVDQIIPDPTQPRFQWDTPDARADLEALADSLESEGQLSPITVMPDPAGTDLYMLEDGERRWRAAQLRGLKELDAILSTPDRLLDPTERLLAQLAHNTGRPLTPLEKARAFARLTEEGISQADIAKRTGTPRSTVGDYVRLAQLPKPWLDLMGKGKLQASHAPALSPFRELPDALHREAAEDVMGGVLPGDDPMSVDDFDYEVRLAYEAFLWPLSELKAGYDGVVITYKKRWGDDKPRKYAAEPDKWRKLKKPAEQPKASSADTSWKKQQEKWEAQQARERAKREKLQQVRSAQFAAVAAAVPGLSDARWSDGSWWRFVIEWMLDSHLGGIEQLCALLGVQGVKGRYDVDYYEPLRAYAEGLDTNDARSRFILQLCVATDARVGYVGDKAETLTAAAELLGINLDAIALTEPEAKGTKWERRNKRGKARREKAASQTAEEQPLKASDVDRSSVQAALEHEEKLELCEYCGEPECDDTCTGALAAAGAFDEELDEATIDG